MGKAIMPRITKPVAERRREILDTARAMFLENGYDQTQVADISKRMNVASGLIFHYYKTKAELLYAVIDELADEQRQTLQGILDESKESALDRLQVFFPSPKYLERHEILLNSLVHDKAIMEYCKQKFTTINMPMLCTLIEEGNQDGSWHCENPPETAAFILHGLLGVSELLGETAHDAENKLRIATPIILRILGVPAHEE
jgi:AcrR family transcriptional regulator